jgi:multimeric flavodoxin WrbA
MGEFGHGPLFWFAMGLVLFILLEIVTPGALFLIARAPEAEAEALAIASPAHFADVAPEAKRVTDRAGYADLRNGNAPGRKPGAAAVAAGRAHSCGSINGLLGITQMFAAGSRYRNQGVAPEPGSAAGDRGAEDAMRALGANMAWLLGRLRG